MKTLPYLITFLFFIACCASCDNDDDFSTDGNLRLSFSSETIKFDTVFTSFGTSTRRLKVYNKNKNALSINSIALMNAEKTGFRMNVDGESGNSINNVDILAEDSIYVFIEATIYPLNQNTPLLIADSIRFQFNGVTQYVRLEAIGQDVILWEGKTIDKDTILTGEKPFLIYETLHVNPNVTLTLNENVHLYFHSKAKLFVEGSLQSKGTIEKPVVIRGDRTDLFLESLNVPYDRVPGQWEGIEIASGSFNNLFENTQIRSSIYGILFQQSEPTQLKASLLNTIVQNTTKENIFAINCKIEAKNSLFANSGTSSVNLIGGDYNFLHCTIASYIPGGNLGWDRNRKQALILANKGTDNQGNELNIPLVNSQFINTIISGKSSPEIKLEKNDNIAFNHTFTNCLIKAAGTDDSNFINTVWNVNPAFKYIYDPYSTEENPQYYYFNYQLTENSPARNKASRQYAAELPEDIKGNSRRSDEAPDIGCYEWQ
ncbi:MAG: choice-of-anchor Q domain-containing protein [Dysgonomonas sp.]|nr:choice-of-anchor Q domain-containing protein [Dysgonomonas sp.]